MDITYRLDKFNEILPIYNVCNYYRNPPAAFHNNSVERQSRNGNSKNIKILIHWRMLALQKLHIVSLLLVGLSYFRDSVLRPIAVLNEVANSKYLVLHPPTLYADF